MAKMTSEQMEMAKLKAELEKARAENDALRAKKASAPISLKVSEKGGVSVYGIGRFPVTLYREQWERLLGHKDNILTFIKDNASKLAIKGQDNGKDKE